MRKKIFGLVFAVFAAVVMSVTANAEYVTEGVFEFDTESGIIYRCDRYEAKGDITIPAEIAGVKVVGIDSGAFSNCQDITSVTIPNSVISIGNDAFDRCSNMETIKIPDSVMTIGDYVFDGCEALGNITLPDSLTSIGFDAFRGTAYYNNADNWENGVLYIGQYLVSTKSSEIGEEYAVKQGTRLIANYAFAETENLMKVIIPNGVEIIGAEAFFDSGLTSITMSDSVRIIGFGAFESSALESVTIPAGVEEINASFALCRSLKSIDVAAGNKYYTADNGVLFNKDKTVLVCYPAGRPDSEYYIPKSVTSIGAYSFYGSVTIESIWVPASVVRVEDYAFHRTITLEDIYFEASSDDVFYNLSIGDRNGSFESSNLHYNASKIPPITVDVESDFANSAVFNVKVTEGSMSAVQKAKLYLAEYDSEGRVTNVYVGENGEVSWDGEMTITAPLPSEDAYSYKYMLWDKSNAPLMEAVTDIPQE